MVITPPQEKKERSLPVKEERSAKIDYREKQETEIVEPSPPAEEHEVKDNHREKEETKKIKLPLWAKVREVKDNLREKHQTVKAESPPPVREHEVKDEQRGEPEAKKTESPLPVKENELKDNHHEKPEAEKKKQSPPPRENGVKVNYIEKKETAKTEPPLPARENIAQSSTKNTPGAEIVSPPVEKKAPVLPEKDKSVKDKSVPEKDTSQLSKEVVQNSGIVSPPVETEDSVLPETDAPTLEAEVEKSIEFILEEDIPEPEPEIPQPKPESKKKHTGGPLAGIRILDLTRLYPGPLATMLMAELGAEVIKIEDRISADDMRTYPPYIGEDSAGYLAVNRSKRSLALKFNEERGQEVFFQLVKTADLVIEQFRPGALDRVGMGYYEAIKANPKIIYISLTGYGQYGPYAKRAGHDINYMGYSGIISTTGAEKAGLVLPGVQIADIAGGAYMAVIAALSALWARERTGGGQRVDVSMLDSVLPLMSLQMAHYWATDKELPPWQLPLSGGMPFYGIYKCADDRYIALGAIEPKFWKQFCELIDKPDWVSRYYSDERDAEKLKMELARMFRSRTRDSWIELVGKADLCLSPVLDMAEVEDDPHLQARGMIVEYDHPEYGRIKGIGVPLKFSRQERHTPTPPPALGEHTLEILYELGYEDKDIRDMLRKGAVYIHKKK